MFSLYLFRGHFSQINFQSTHVIVAIFHVRGASLAVGISWHSTDARPRPHSGRRSAGGAAGTPHSPFAPSFASLWRNDKFIACF